MSYSEYLKMFKSVQQKDCPFRAFSFDVVNSRQQNIDLNQKENYFDFILYVYYLLEQEEKELQKPILLKNQFNKKFSLFGKKDFNNNNYNPMVIGDLATFFVYNNSISTKRMLQIFSEAMNKYKITYSFHFSTGVYETNNYVEGGTKLYKGYMPQILENLSKYNDTIITSDYCSNSK